MKTTFYYWGLVSVLGIIHFQALIMNLPFMIPVYLTCAFVIGAVFYISRRLLLRISFLGALWNSLFFLLQLLLVMVHLVNGPSILPLFVFAGMEIIRLHFAKELSDNNRRIKQFEEQSVQMNETFRLVRNERHDFLKHISAIHFLLEKGESEQAKTYLSGLVEGYEETNLSIKGEKGVVAGILNQMYRRAKAAGISVVYNLDVPVSTLPLSDQELVTLIGNILSNSLDACEDWQALRKQQSFITLQFYKRGGLYILTCINSSPPIPTEILDELFHTYGKTTKQHGHEGLGTKMIQDIVKHHNGFLDFVYKDEEFTLKIKMPAIQ
ncbi:sensor histidine kinase [Neobacillus sp. SCS-31]|uniref:sensor histidine kinase n=1 Tax=Neobacillus oceani TaxID=3115292 RepID=UPI0039060A8D